MNTLLIGGVEVAIDDTTVQWRSGMTVDADGAFRAYAPAGSGLEGLDYLADAGHDGAWCGAVTDTGKPSGKPLIQGPNDPAPGYLISPTALVDPSKPDSDPTKYVQADVFAYLSIPPELRHFLGQPLLAEGDVGIATYKNASSPFIIGDSGPHGKLTEGSMKLANNLVMDPSPKHGGVGAGVTFLVWRGSSRGWPRAWQSIVDQVAQLRAPQLVD